MGAIKRDSQYAGGRRDTRNQRELLELQEALIANALANLRLGKEQLSAGTINSFNYRQLEFEYFNAEQSGINAVYGLLLSDHNLRQAAGRLEE